MIKLYKSEQTGRSMIEMLGVLAIIGVLSVGGIAGYSKAMSKYKTTKVIDQASMLIANIRMAYNGKLNFIGLNTAAANTMGVADSNMLIGTTALANAYSPTTASVYVEGTTTTGANVGITFAALPQDACVVLVTTDWGVGSGYVGAAVTATNSNAKAVTAAPAVATNTSTLSAASWGLNFLPVAPANAATACGNANSANAVTLYFVP